MEIALGILAVAAMGAAVIAITKKNALASEIKGLRGTAKSSSEDLDKATRRVAELEKKLDKSKKTVTAKDSGADHLRLTMTTA